MSAADYQRNQGFCPICLQIITGPSAGFQPASNSKRKILGALGWLLALGLVALIGFQIFKQLGLGSSKTSSILDTKPPSTAVSVQKKAPTFKNTSLGITPQKFDSWYQKNPTSAQKWLEGRTLQIVGRLDYVNKDIVGKDQVALVFNCDSSGEQTQMSIWFGPEYKKQLESLQVGQQISVTCTFDGISHSEYNMAGITVTPQ